MTPGRRQTQWLRPLFPLPAAECGSPRRTWILRTPVSLCLLAPRCLAFGITAGVLAWPLSAEPLAADGARSFRSAGIVNHYQHGSAYPSRQYQIVVDSQRRPMPRSTMWSMNVAGTFRATLASRSGCVAGAVLMIFLACGCARDKQPVRPSNVAIDEVGDNSRKGLLRNAKGCQDRPTSATSDGWFAVVRMHRRGRSCSLFSNAYQLPKLDVVAN